MVKPNYVNLDKFMEAFTLLEKKISEINSKNNELEIELQDVNRHLKFNLTKEKSLIEERDSLLVAVTRLQQAMQEQCHLREENERLKTNLAAQKKQIEQTAQDGDAKVHRLMTNMRAEKERHKRELEALKQQCQTELQIAQREGFSQLAAKDAKVKNLLEQKDVELEEMKKKLRDQEREKQGELLKLQMEFGAKLARVQNTTQWSQQQQQQQQTSSLLPQSIFKRKLQFLQEQKNKEILALRQRIKELEENQFADSHNDSCLKRRKN